MRLSEDLLVGAQAIGDEIGESARRTFVMLEKKMIPGFKVGSKWCARRSSLQAHFERLEAEAMAAAIDPPQPALPPVTPPPAKKPGILETLDAAIDELKAKVKTAAGNPPRRRRGRPPRAAREAVAERA